MTLRTKFQLIGYILLSSLCWELTATPSPKSQEKVSIDTLAILSFNDFHGAFPKEYTYPGAASMVQEVLNEQKKYNNTIVLAGGDNYSGSYFARITQGEPLPEVFRMMNVEASAIGNHEFDWGIDYLKQASQEYLRPVSANITTDGYHLPNWLSPYRIVERKLKNGETFRTAIIGLTTIDTPTKTSAQNVKGLQFIHPMAATTIQTLYNLKQEGQIDLIVLLMHISTNMRYPNLVGNREAEYLPYIDGIDAIISGHSHKVVLGKVNNVPVIQAGANGTHIGKLCFQIRTTGKHIETSYIGGDTIKVTAPANQQIEEIVQQVMKEKKLAEKLTVAKEALIHDSNVPGNKYSYTTIGAYVTASYADYFKRNGPADYRSLPVIGVNHYGGLRSSLYPGDVTTLRAGNILPFCGDLLAYKFTGKSLKRLLNEGRHNYTGYLQTSNVTLRINKEGEIEQIFQNGEEITDTTPCVVVLDNFITTGGDGYSIELFTGNEIKEFNQRKIVTTNVFIDYLGSSACKPNLSVKRAPVPKIMN
mgnify:CR=1 FL=1